MVCEGCERHVSTAIAEDGVAFRRERRVDSRGDIHETVYASDGTTVSGSDFEAHLVAARQARLIERGAMTAELASYAARMARTDHVLVRGWLAFEAEPEDRLGSLAGRGDLAADQNLEHLELQAAELSASVRRATDLVQLDLLSGTPLFTAVVGPRALNAIARSPFVQLLELDPGPGEPCTTNWKNAVGADVTEAAGWDGTGVTVAVLEGDRPDVYTGLGIVATASLTGYTDPHSRQVAGMIRQGVSPFGIADNASIVIANWDMFSVLNTNVDRWAIAQGAKVINFSWSFSAGNNGGVSTLDLYHDYLALRTPLVLYTVAAGNGGSDSNIALRYVQNRSYNGLVVGAIDDRGTDTRADDIIASFSSYRNHTTTNGDRELPEVVAPGTNVTTTGSIVSGTSFATPIVAGTLACMLEANPNLGAWPEAQKAIVMATADCNRDGVLLNLTDATDDKDGAGLLNTSRAVTLAQNANLRTSASPASVRGHAYGSMDFFSSGGNFAGSIFSQSFNVVTDGGGRLSVVLTWDATSSCTNVNEPTTCTGLGPDSDLNLFLFRASDNTFVASSTSFDNNYEALIGRMLSPNTAYRIEIRRGLTVRANTYYSLAWDSFTAGCPDP